MPWKTTKLVFCGIPLRRRSLYVITLACSIAGVPTISWGLLALGGAFTRGQQIGFIAAAVVSLVLALHGWRLILKNKSILFREEARVIWPGSVVLLLVATGFACVVAHGVMKRGLLDFAVPLVLGGGLLVVLLTRCFQLNNHPKRSSVARGDSGHRRSRSSSTTSPILGENVAGEADEEEADDDEGPAPPPEVSSS